MNIRIPKKCIALCQPLAKKLSLRWVWEQFRRAREEKVHREGAGVCMREGAEGRSWYLYERSDVGKRAGEMRRWADEA